MAFTASNTKRTQAVVIRLIFVVIFIYLILPYGIPNSPYSLNNAGSENPSSIFFLK